MKNKTAPFVVAGVGNSSAESNSRGVRLASEAVSVGHVVIGYLDTEILLMRTLKGKRRPLLCLQWPREISMLREMSKVFSLHMH